MSSVSQTTEPSDLAEIREANLLQNAILHGVTDGILALKPGGRITVLAAPEQDTAHLSVSDTGIGIPEEALPHIFQKFYQVDGSHTRVYKGVGLGLSIEKSLVEAHHGVISVHSKLGQGSKFHVTLPKHPRQTSDADPDEPSR